MPKILATLHGPTKGRIPAGPYAISKMLTMDFLPVGSAVAFQIPFTQGGEEGAIVIQANGTLIGIIDWYMGIEKRGTVIYNNVSLTATGITPRRFSEIISASWLNNLGWKVDRKSVV